MKTELHQKKIQILGRLIKESSLTLEEALVLLEQEEETQVTPSYTNPYINLPYTHTVPLTGTVTVPNNGFFTTTGTSNATFTTTNTAGFAQSVLEDLKNATEDADL